jgi:spermidine synthase
MSELYANKLDTKEERVNGIVLDAITTHRGTHVEMIQCPTWNIACYMDGIIQSCEMDEATYHESLVHPIMSNTTLKKRVLIIGGGEGATAREVLKWPVEQVDMYDWDEEVVQLFQNKYPQWAKGAWEDKRLTLHFDNIFDIISEEPSAPYDIIIIDLFDPEEGNREAWSHLFQNLHKWMTRDASIVIYSGMLQPNQLKQPYQLLKDLITYPSCWGQDKLVNKEIISYKVPIQSFLGESVFLFIRTFKGWDDTWIIPDTISSHITSEKWKSYRNMN